MFWKWNPRRGEASGQKIRTTWATILNDEENSDFDANSELNWGGGWWQICQSDPTFSLVVITFWRHFRYTTYWLSFDSSIPTFSSNFHMLLKRVYTSDLLLLQYRLLRWFGTWNWIFLATLHTDSKSDTSSWNLGETANQILLRNQEKDTPTL